MSAVLHSDLTDQRQYWLDRFTEVGAIASKHGAQPDELASAIDLAGQLDGVACRLEIAPASTLASKEPPPPRDAICREIALFAGRVSTLFGNGGEGKTTIAHQFGMAAAANRPLWGMDINGGAVVAIYCEDEQEEVDRKTRLIAEAEGIPLSDLDDFYALSRDGRDNVLASFDRDKIVLSRFYRELDETLDYFKPRLLILDTLADMFAGDFMSTPHARQFIKIALGGLAARHGSAILMLGHPSASGMASGSGAGFSTAWNNSVRSRLYLRRPKTEDAAAAADRRVLEVMKSNYGPTGATVPLVYEDGRFVLDPDPLPESGSTRAVKAVKADTRLALAVLDYFRASAPGGQVVAFGAIFQAMQRVGEIKGGEYEEARKPLQRTLKALCAEGVLILTAVPKGYRLQQRGAE